MLYYKIKTREDVTKELKTELEYKLRLQSKLGDVARYMSDTDDPVFHLQAIYHEILETTGRIRVLYSANAMLNEREDKISGAEVWHLLVENYLLQGADDGWSGRGNDTKRIVHDAMRETVRDLKYPLEKL